MADWQAGDLARCVDTRDLRLPLRRDPAMGGRYLVSGMVYIVRAVARDCMGETGLDVGARFGFKLARRFVKVPPLAEIMDDACETRRVEVGA